MKLLFTVLLGVFFIILPSTGRAQLAIDWVSDTHFSGGGVLFTPQQNIQVSSVTLWLSGYTGQYGIVPMVYFSGDYTGEPPLNIPSQFEYPYTPTAANIDTPPPNDGSLASFTFDFTPFTLDAGTEYWLDVLPSEYQGINWQQVYNAGFTWDGASLSGAVNVVGSAPFYFTPEIQMPLRISPGSPGFSVNPVPEPATLALAGLGGLVFLALGRRK